MKRFTRPWLKGQARERLSRHWSFYAGISGAEFLFTYILNEFFNTFFPVSSSSVISYLITTLIMGVFTTIVSIGAAGIYLNSCRDRQTRYADLFYGFSHHPEYLAFYYLMKIGILIACTSIPMSFLVLGPAYSVPVRILLLLLFGAGVVLGNVLLLPLSLFPYLYMDAPDKAFRDLLLESRDRMKGQKKRFFLLECSFLGMLLLGVLSMGIGLIWIRPYIGMTKAIFYLNLTRLQD